MTQFTILRGAATAVALTLAPAPALAVFSGDMSPRAESGDADYAAAIRAKADNDWCAVIEHLDKVVERRPWHDNAHNLLGYAHRQMEDYDKALSHYFKALDHNPRHREALEYLGEAYLLMGDTARAKETLDRLARVCGGVTLTFSDGYFTDGCNEYRELAESYEHYMRTGTVPDREQAGRE